MRTFFHPEQLLHHPRSYYSRGQMRTPQEVPERALNLLLAAQTLGFEIRQPADYGLEPLLAVHGAANSKLSARSGTSCGVRIWPRE